MTGLITLRYTIFEMGFMRIWVFHGDQDIVSMVMRLQADISLSFRKIFDSVHGIFQSIG